jgi:hypothetical protein
MDPRKNNQYNRKNEEFREAGKKGITGYPE